LKSAPVRILRVLKPAATKARLAARTIDQEPRFSLTDTRTIRQKLLRRELLLVRCIVGIAFGVTAIEGWLVGGSREDTLFAKRW